MNVLETLKMVLLLIWGYAGVKVIVVHTVLNVVVAVAAAVKNNDLQLAKIGEFLYRKLLPYVGVYFAVKLLGESAGLTALGPIVWLVIEATLLGDLTDSLGRLGLALPQWLRKTSPTPIQ